MVSISPLPGVYLICTYKLIFSYKTLIGKDYSQFSEEMLQYLGELSVQHTDSATIYKSFCKRFGKQKLRTQVNYKVAKVARTVLLQFIKLFCLKKVELSSRLANLPIVIYRIMMTPANDYLFDGASQHYRDIMNVYVKQCWYKNRKDAYGIMSKVTCRRKVQQIMDILLMLTVMRMTYEGVTITDLQFKGLPFQSISDLKQHPFYSKFFQINHPIHNTFLSANVNQLNAQEEFSVNIGDNEPKPIPHNQNNHKIIIKPPDDHKIKTIRGRIRSNKTEFRALRERKFEAELLKQLEKESSQEEDLDELQNLFNEREHERKQKLVFSRINQDEDLYKFLSKDLKKEVQKEYERYLSQFDN